jgi:hypothetical protein
VTSGKWGRRLDVPWGKGRLGEGMRLRKGCGSRKTFFREKVGEGRKWA